MRLSAIHPFKRGDCIKKKLHIAVLHTWDRRYSRFQDRWAHSWAEPGAKAIKWPGILWRTIRLLKPPLKFINKYQGIQKTLTKRNLVDNEGAGFCILYIQVTLLHDVRPHRHLFKIQMSNRRKAKTNFKQLRCLIDPLLNGSWKPLNIKQHNKSKPVIHV